MEYGVLSIIPLAVLCVMVFTTKRVLLSLLAATLAGAILLSGLSFGETWLGLVQEAFMAGNIGFLILLLGLFGVLIGQLETTGAAMEFAHWLGKFANTRKKALFITYLLGICIFIDEYLNCMIISTSMKRVTDKFRIPRSFLGYVVNSTGSPVSIIVPVSAWAIFYAGLYESEGIVVNGSGMGTYIAAIPYMFFGWITLIIMCLVVLGVLPMIGISAKHRRLAEETGILASTEVALDGKAIMAQEMDEQEESQIKAAPWSFLITLATIVTVTIVSGLNVMVGAMAAIAALSVISLLRKKVRLSQLLDGSCKGVTDMSTVCILIVLACTLVTANEKLGLSGFVVGTLAPYLSGALLPAAVFGFCAIYACLGGGFWDMTMVFFPMVIPLASAVGADPVLAGAALVCSAAMGSATYVGGDCVNIVSRGLDIKPVYVTLATLPYSAVSYVITIVCFAAAGLIG